MKLSEVKSVLEKLQTVRFQLPNGTLVPHHFHITEVGKTSRRFIDCGGVIGNKNFVHFQLWNANDYDHRLYPKKLISIIELSQKLLEIEDLEVEVEYQGQTIQKFGLAFNGENFLLTTTQTDCLAKGRCETPKNNQKKKSTTLGKTCC